MIFNAPQIYGFKTIYISKIGAFTLQIVSFLPKSSCELNFSRTAAQIIGLSWAVAKKLNFVRYSLAQVELKIIDTIPHK